MTTLGIFIFGGLGGVLVLFALIAAWHQFIVFIFPNNPFSAPTKNFRP